MRLASCVADGDHLSINILSILHIYRSTECARAATACARLDHRSCHVLNSFSATRSAPGLFYVTTRAATSIKVRAANSVWGGKSAVQ